MLFGPMWSPELAISTFQKLSKCSAVPAISAYKQDYLNLINMGSQLCHEISFICTELTGGIDIVSHVMSYYRHSRVKRDGQD